MESWDYYIIFYYYGELTSTFLCIFTNMMAQSETDRVNEASVRFFDPMQLFSTQEMGCSCNDHVIP